MASLSIQGSVSNIFGATVLKDHIEGFVARSLQQIDLNQGTISKVKLVIVKAPFLKVAEGDGFRYNCYNESTVKHKHSWDKPSEESCLDDLVHSLVNEQNPPLSAEEQSTVKELLKTPQLQESFNQSKAQVQAEYTHFTLHQKEIVQADLNHDLTEDWTNLAKQVAECINKHGPLAYVEGNITLEVTTIDKNSNAPRPAQSFQTAFKIGDEQVYL